MFDEATMRLYELATGDDQEAAELAVRALKAGGDEDVLFWLGSELFVWRLAEVERLQLVGQAQRALVGEVDWDGAARREL